MIQFGLPHGLALRVPGAARSGARSAHRDSLAGRSAHDTTIRQERWRYGHGGQPGTGARSVPGAGRVESVDCRLAGMAGVAGPLQGGGAAAGPPDCPESVSSGQ